MGPILPEAAPGAPGRRSGPPLAALARGLTPPPILVAIPRVGGGARRRGVNPRFPRGEEGPGTPLVPHRGQKVPTDSAEEANLFASLEKVGEKLTFGIEPSQLPEFLAERGLSLERDVGAAEYRELYFKDAARKMRGHEFYRVALARVGPPNSRLERSGSTPAAEPGR